MKNLIAFLSLLFLVSCENAKRNNPLDASANNFRDLIVLPMADTTVAINDSFFVHVSGLVVIGQNDKPTDQKSFGQFKKFLWSHDGLTYFDTTEVESIKVAWTEPGKKKIYVEAVDDEGFHSQDPNDFVNILVKLYAPSVIAMADTSVWINDTLKLHANGTDSNGTILKSYWAVNGINFSDSSSASVFNTSFSTSGLKSILVKVRDDDGVYSSSASFKVNVKLGAPVTRPVPDTAVWINDSLKLHVIATDSNGTVVKYLWAVNGTSFLDSSDAPNLYTSFANPGLKLVLVKVRDDDGVISSIDTIKITAKTKNANADLATLAFSAGAISPVLNKNDTSYTVTVANDVVATTITPTAAAPITSTITVKGTAVTSGTASTSHSLITGTNTFTIIIKAESGITKTYTVNVNRDKNANANLAGLKVSHGKITPAFMPGDTVYTLSIANNIGAITLTPLAAITATSTITVNGAAIVSGEVSPSLPLVVGNNPTTIIATAESGVTKKYVITVKRMPADWAYLTGLTLSAGNLTPAFNDTVLAYSLSVDYPVAKTTITATLLDSATDSIRVNGNMGAKGTLVRSGFPSDSIPLTIGVQSIEVVVTSTSGATKTYTILVTRKPAGSTALLGLELSAGPLSPSFNGDTLDYNLSSPILKTTVKATAFTPTSSSISINGIVVASGKISDSIPLNLGLNTISIVVLSNDSTFKTYKVSLTRVAGGSTNLAGLALSAGTINPLFSDTILSYTCVTVLATTTITPTASTPLTSTIKINGTLINSGVATTSISLLSGNSSFSVVVLSNDGTSKAYSLVVTRINPTFSKVAAGGSHSLILKSDKTLWATGWNQFGQLGNGTTTDQLKPIQIMTAVSNMVASRNNSLILKTDGTLWGSGDNYDSQLGDGIPDLRITPFQIMSGVTSMAAGMNYTLILKSDRTLWTTGNNGSGQLGYTTTFSHGYPPKQIMSEVANMTAGAYHTLILKTDGTLWATGSNTNGQLGDGTTTNRKIPYQMMSGVASMAAGNYHTLILKTDGTLWATGSNTSGQMGDGTTTNRLTPYQMMSGVMNVEAGGNYTLILRTDGTRWVTGSNIYELGDGTTTNRLTPYQMMSGVMNMAAGSGYTLILKTDGTLWATGSNESGQLGDGTTTNRSLPVKIAF
jgi:alpha-tubulin suppressor-like RCC1 family protein